MGRGGGEGETGSLSGVDTRRVRFSEGTETATGSHSLAQKSENWGAAQQSGASDPSAHSKPSGSVATPRAGTGGTMGMRMVLFKRPLVWTLSRTQRGGAAQGRGPVPGEAGQGRAEWREVVGGAAWEKGSQLIARILPLPLVLVLVLVLRVRAVRALRLSALIPQPQGRAPAPGLHKGAPHSPPPLEPPSPSPGPAAETPESSASPWKLPCSSTGSTRTGRRPSLWVCRRWWLTRLPGALGWSWEDSGECLNGACHAVARPLFKQRFLSLLLPKLSAQITSCSPHHGPARYCAVPHCTVVHCTFTAL